MLGLGAEGVGLVGLRLLNPPLGYRKTMMVM